MDGARVCFATTPVNGCHNWMLLKNAPRQHMPTASRRQGRQDDRCQLGGQDDLVYSFNLESVVPHRDRLRGIERCLDLTDLRNYVAECVFHLKAATWARQFSAQIPRLVVRHPNERSGRFAALVVSLSVSPGLKAFICL